MAIKRDFTDEYDNLVTNAYSRIVDYQFTNLSTVGTFKYNVATWKSKAAFNNHKKPFTDEKDTFEVLESDLTSSNLNGLYAHLLLQAKYSTGTQIAD